ncbi:MAG: rod shape-determining protein MreC [Oscillospiraceae bacterium]|nr:rod shape-determining protein MreC [Oscillospiraceae bacterium]
MQAENRRLQEELSRIEIIRAENAILRAYNNMTEMYQEYETVPAYIIDKSISNLSDTFVINVGSNQGVQANMPVISGEGLVGFTISSTRNTAKVAPIIDPASSVSARISTSRDPVITRGMLGNNRQLRLTYIRGSCRLSTRRYHRNIRYAEEYIRKEYE